MFPGCQVKLESTVGLTFDFPHRRIQTEIGTGIFCQQIGFRREFRTGQFFLESMKTEPGVNALIQNTAGTFFTVDHKGGTSGRCRFFCRKQTGCTATDNGYIVG